MESNSWKTKRSEQRSQLLPLRGDRVYNLSSTQLEGLNEHLKLSTENSENPHTETKE